MHNIGYHTWYGFLDDTEGLKTIISGGTQRLSRAACFDQFWNAYHYSTAEQYFVFGWEAVPKYIEEIVDSFNNTFKNIKIVLLDTTDVYYKNFSVGIEPETKNAKSVLLTIKPSDKYKIENIQYIYYIIHHLFRFLSLSEDVYTNKKVSCLFVQDNEERDFCTLISKINDYWLSNNYSYRGIEVSFTPEDLKLIDNVEMFNSIFSRFDHHIKKQTDIIFSLIYNSPDFKPRTLEDGVNSFIKESHLKKGDKVLVDSFNDCVDSFNDCVASITGVVYEPTKVDYEAQKHFFRNYNPTATFFRIVVEMDEGIRIHPTSNIYRIEDGYFLVSNTVLHNACSICNSPTPSIIYKLYFGMCIECATKNNSNEKYHRHICNKHVNPYCMECPRGGSLNDKKLYTEYTPLEYAEKKFASLGLKGFKFI